MRAFFIYLFMGLGFSAISQGKFKLHISFNEDPGDSVKLVFNKNIFKVASSGNQAIFEGEINEATRASVTISESNCLIMFYLEPAVIHVKAEVFTTGEGKKCIGKKEITGSSMESKMNAFEADLKKVRKKYEPEFATRKLREMVMAIVKEYPGQYISVDLITRFHKELGTEWSLSALEYIDDKIKGNAESYVLKASMSTELLKKGNIIDFTLPALQDSFTLSSLKGKYVLLDFWASWCLPCRKENPKLKKIYEKYKDEGLEIVGVSLDHESEKWKEAIIKDGLPWIHVSDLKGWQNNVSATLGISSIPTAILLDREGRIVDFGLRGNELERAIEKLISKKD